MSFLTKELINSLDLNTMLLNENYDTIITFPKETNLRLVQNENNRSGLFCYPKDRAKVAHGLWDCESVLKNNLRYLCFDSLPLGELRVRV